MSTSRPGIGSQRIHTFPATNNQRLHIGYPAARLHAVTGCLTDVDRVSDLEEQPRFASGEMD